MAKARATRRTLDSFTVKSINKAIRAGDCVLMRPSDSSKPSYVARVETIESDSRGANVRVHVRWYYRPEESIGGRRQFHGSKELFLSDHYDVQSADTIEGKCTVHSFKGYTKLDAVGNDDYFCRFEYNSSTGAFNPDRVAVYVEYNPYCKCEMPYNPDDLMVQCEGCADWFHPNCIDMTPEEARKLEHFYCQNCSSEDKKKLRSSHATSKKTDTKSANNQWRNLDLKIEVAPKKINIFDVKKKYTCPKINYTWIQNAVGGNTVDMCINWRSWEFNLASSKHRGNGICITSKQYL